MAHEWYIQHGGKQYGPLSSANLKKLAAERKITPSTSVRRGAEGGWVPASRVQGLFAAPAAAKPPPAPNKAPAAPQPVRAEGKPSEFELPPLDAADLSDMDLPPPAAPPPPPPVASAVARVPVGTVAPAKASAPESSMAPKILGAVGLVFGTLAVATCWLPFLKDVGPIAWTGIIVGGLGLILGATGLAISAVKNGSGLYLNVAGTSSAAVGLVMTVVLGISFGLFTAAPAPKEVIVHRPAPPIVETPAPVIEPEPEPEPEPVIVWTDASETIEQGPIRAKIEGASVLQIRLESSDLSTIKRSPPKPMLKIRVTLENATADKMVDAPGWNGGLGGALSPELAGAAADLLKGSDAAGSLTAATATATLVDNLGNNYKQTPAVQVFGAQITLGEDNSLRPGDTTTKELIFQPPLDAETIEYLRLELSPSGFSGAEPLRFQIPIAMIAGR